MHAGTRKAWMDWLCRMPQASRVAGKGEAEQHGRGLACVGQEQDEKHAIPTEPSLGAETARLQGWPEPVCGAARRERAVPATRTPTTAMSCDATDKREQACCSYEKA